jgi:hypothetical protein
MMLLRSLLLFIVTLCFYSVSIHSYADNDDLEHLQIKLTNQWQLIKHDKRRNIKTYAKQEDNRPFRSFKVESVLNGSMKDVVQILADFENYKKWYWETIDSKLLKTVSPTEHYIYMTHNAPYGLPDRDAVLRIKVLLQTPEKPQLAFFIEAVPDFMYINKDFVRINAEDMLLSLKPLTYNSIQLIAEGYVDPGGKFPNWANSLIQRTAPYSILLGLQRMLAQKQTKKIVIPFPVLEITDY